MKQMEGVRAAIKAGVPLQSLLSSEDREDLLHIVEGGLGASLGTDRTGREYIEPLSQAEKDFIKDEVKGCHCAVIHDGTTHVCETCCVILHYCKPQTLQYQQQLISLHLYEERINGQEWGAHLICVAEDYTTRKNILFVNQDCVEAN